MTVRAVSDPKDVKIYGNVVYNSSSLGGLYLGSDLGDTLNLQVYNNTFYNAPVVISSNSANVNTVYFYQQYRLLLGRCSLD